MATRPTFREVVNDVLFMNGNRDDLLDAAKSAVRDAIAVVLSMHHMQLLNKIAETTFVIDWPYRIPYPEDCEVVTAVSYYDEDIKQWVPLEEGSLEDILSLSEDIPDVSKPEKYIPYASGLWIYPKLDKAYSGIMAYKRDPQYPTNDTEQLWDLPLTLVPTIKWLAAANLRVIQGEFEVAGTMRQFAAMFGSDKFGPQAKKSHRQDVGIKVEGL